MAKKTNNRKINNKVVVYQAKSGAIELRGDLSGETVWATQAQIVDLFGVDQSVVSRHINNIFRDDEVDRKSNMQKMHIANSDKPVIFYSLDVILSVGYRTNSRVAIAFRKWANAVLRSYITEGYVVNKKQIAKNYQKFLQAVGNIKSLLPSGANVDTGDVLELVSAFADTWISIDSYDKDKLRTSGATKKSVKLNAGVLSDALKVLKESLINSFSQ